jgi:NAD(P)H-flavin reductase
MLPIPYRVIDRHVETHDSVTLRLKPVSTSLPSFQPGQFTMLYAHGVGEIAVSISGDPSTVNGVLTQTIRDVGAVSRALCQARPGTLLGVRGPFGTTWGLDSAAGYDLLIVAGGVGLAPLRPVLLGALARRHRYGRIILIAGARAPGEFLFRDELSGWSARGDLDVELTVDRPADGWSGRVGFVTEALAGLRLAPARTIAFVCGPEAMMRFSAAILLRQKTPVEHIRVSRQWRKLCGVKAFGSFKASR